VSNEVKNSEEPAGLIKSILKQQRFAVLATQSDGQPYSNLVAFAEADDLNILLFVTGRNTRKYVNSQKSKKVAILFDNRTNQSSDLNNAVAVTAVGSVEEVAAQDKVYFSGVYLAKNPELKEFLEKPENALMKVGVKDYIVATFEGVNHYCVSES
jgi:heme iron utilization protein